ncbi:hypothetical protein FQZ97_791400 [compost metagenome]
MVQVGAAEAVAPASVPAHASLARTGVAGAGAVQRLVVCLVARVADFQVTEAGEQRAVARVARGHDAVEHVHAVGHALHQVFRRTDAHQVARLVRRQAVRRVRHDLQHLFFGLAHAHAADGVAGKVHLDQRFERLLPQVLEHAALHDAEERVGVLQPREFVLRAHGPAAAHLHALARLGLGGEVAVGLVGSALVELHHDVTVQPGLDLHAHLGRHEELVAVHRRREVHAFLGDLAHGAERPDLEAARVGEDGFVPFLEAVQAAEAGHDLAARAHPKVEGIAQDDLGAHVFEAGGHDALDRAVGAHGHEDRGFNHAVVEREAATACVAFGLEQFELEHGGDCRRVLQWGSDHFTGASAFPSARRGTGFAGPPAWSPFQGEAAQRRRGYFNPRIQATSLPASASEMATLLGGMARPLTLSFQWLS